MCRIDHISSSGPIFNPEFEILMSCFLFDYAFWWRLRQDLCAFSAKNGCSDANFAIWGIFWGGNFLAKPQKAHPYTFRVELPIYPLLPNGGLQEPPPALFLINNFFAFKILLRAFTYS